MVGLQAVWYLLAGAVSFIGCSAIAKHLSENYKRDGNKFMIGFTYVAVYGIFFGGAIVFLRTNWFS